MSTHCASGTFTVLHKDKYGTEYSTTFKAKYIKINPNPDELCCEIYAYFDAVVLDSLLFSVEIINNKSPLILSLNLESESPLDIMIPIKEIEHCPNFYDDGPYVILRPYPGNSYKHYDNMVKVKNISKYKEVAGDRNLRTLSIKNIWFNDPWTTIKWSDDTITKAKCSDGETFSKEIGVTVCVAKKYLENQGCKTRNSFKKLVDTGVDLKEVHNKRKVMANNAKIQKVTTKQKTKVDNAKIPKINIIDPEFGVDY